MIGFFPNFYPDELLYSILARYHVRSGHITYPATATELYQDNSIRPDIEFVSEFNDDTLSWICKEKSWETIIHKHTMYPAYARFLPKEKQDKALESLLTCKGDWYAPLGISKENAEKYLKYCPLCAEEDRKKHGETYWHRMHQLQNIRICPGHNCFLENSFIPITSSCTRSLGLFDAESNIPSTSNIRFSNCNIEQGFTKYICSVFQESMISSSLSVGLFLYLRLKKLYFTEPDLQQNIEMIYHDYNSFFKSTIIKMSKTDMMNIFNGISHDPYFILQLAYFEGISVKDISCLPAKTSLSGIERLYLELSKKYNINYTIISNIGETILQYRNPRFST